jgi:3',5'-cyclic AMP phosphodiesterase CpdA
MRKASALVLLAFACGGASTEAPHPVTGTPAAEGTVRFIVGGDSRDDSAHVLPWAFREAKARGASAFIFLGDMELTPSFDAHFRKELDILAPVPFYPVLGNHEIRLLGAFNLGSAAAERAFRANFLGNKETPVQSSLEGKVVYSVNLPGHVHFVALDNVSRKGFGKDQMAWLAADLEQARGDSNVRHIFIGMHKPLAHNGVAAHGMDADGADGEADSNAALDLFEHYRVELILASHVHQFIRFSQRNIPSYITGGLGAPLNNTSPEHGFHHFLVIDVAGDQVRVDVAKFDGTPSTGPDDIAD